MVALSMALVMFIFRVKGIFIFVSSNLINSCVIMKHPCSGCAASQAPAWVLEEKDNLGAFQGRSGTARLTSPMALPALATLGGTENVALSRTGSHWWPWKGESPGPEWLWC